MIYKLLKVRKEEKICIKENQYARGDAIRGIPQVVGERVVDFQENTVEGLLVGEAIRIVEEYIHKLTSTHLERKDAYKSKSELIEILCW